MFTVKGELNPPLSDLSIAEGARNSECRVKRIHVHCACTYVHAHVTKHMLLCTREHHVYHGNAAGKVTGLGRAVW